MHPRKSLILSLVLILVNVAALAGLFVVGSAQTGQVHAGAAFTVDMQEFKFVPATLGSAAQPIPVGSTVTWTNIGQFAHTTTSDSTPPLWNSSADPRFVGGVQPGQSFSFTFTAAGTYQYHCIFHQFAGMVGTIIVGSAGTTATPTPTSTNIPLSSATPTASASGTSTPATAPSSTNTLTGTPSNTMLPTGTQTPTSTNTPLPLVSPTSSRTPGTTATSTVIPTTQEEPGGTEPPLTEASDTPTVTQTRLPAPTVTGTASHTLTCTPTQTATATGSVTSTATPQRTGTGTATPRPTATSTSTATAPHTMPSVPPHPRCRALTRSNKHGRWIDLEAVALQPQDLPDARHFSITVMKYTNGKAQQQPTNRARVVYASLFSSTALRAAAQGEHVAVYLTEFGDAATASAALHRFPEPNKRTDHPWKPRFVGETARGWHSPPSTLHGRTTSAYTLLFTRGPVIVLLEVSGAPGTLNPDIIARYARTIDARLIMALGCLRHKSP